MDNRAKLYTKPNDNNYITIKSNYALFADDASIESNNFLHTEPPHKHIKDPLMSTHLSPNGQMSQYSKTEFLKNPPNQLHTLPKHMQPNTMSN